MADLRISKRAERDLEDIRAWGMAAFGQTVSDRHLEGFLRIFALLRDYPHAGASRPMWGRSIRSVVHRPHRVLYRVRSSTVLIVRILHTSRDVRLAMRSGR